MAKGMYGKQKRGSRYCSPYGFQRTWKSLPNAMDLDEARGPDILYMISIPDPEFVNFFIV
jgi:hypothetical protein